MNFNKVEQFFFEKTGETRLPSVTAAVIKDGQVIWSKAFGLRDINRGLSATPQTLYGIGSVTKSFTSLAILQLAEKGLLKLDDPISKFLPFEIKPMGEEVRIWHFLSHSSGIPGLGYAEAMIGDRIGATNYWLPLASNADVLTFMADAQDWVWGKPGERWFYLNEGYALLSAIIEKVSGLPYADYLKKNIFEPLGMDRTLLSKDEFDKDRDAAVPYVTTQDGTRLPSVYPFGGISGDGGILSSVLEMAKYIQMYLNWGKTSSGQLVSRASIEDMEKPRVKTPNAGGPFGDYEYALGLGITPNFLGHRLIGHGGSVGVATAYMGFLPEENVGVAVLANGSGYSPAQFGQYALAAVLGSDPDELPFVRREAMLKELEGTYETYRGTIQWKMKKAGDFLVAEDHDKYSTSSIPLFPDVLEKERRLFFTIVNGVRMPLEFTVKDGQVEMIYERYMFRRTGK
jgi:CubicO group peptidase (beta-lactamase class C family)